MHQSFLSEKISKFKEIRREEGLKAALAYSLTYLIAKTGWYREKRFFARLVELRGNRARIDGCTFDVSIPHITPLLKSRFIRNQFETEERIAVRRYLDPALPLIELGGFIGVVSCIANRKLADPYAHVAVEADPALIPLLTKNRDMNECSFSIVNKALAYGAREVVFHQNEGPSTGSVNRPTGRSIVVPTVTLADLMEEFKFPYANLICDIEGGELDLVSHEKELLTKRVYQIIFDLHPSLVGVEAVRRLREDLLAAGFRKLPLGRYSNVLVLQNAGISR